MGLTAVLVAVVACSTPRPTPREEHPDRTPPQTGKARAFVIEDTRDLLGGPAAQGRVGDVRIENGTVAFVVTAIDRDVGFTVSGGNLIDAAAAGGGDDLGELNAQLGAFPEQADYDAIAIEERAGSVAVRASGRESHDPDVEVTTEYELRDASPVLQIRTTLVSHRASPVPVRPLGDAVAFGVSRRFVPGFGFEMPDENGVPFLIGVGTEASYAYGSRSAWVAGDHGRTWTDAVVVRAPLAPGERLTYSRFLAVVPGADAAAAARVARSHRGERIASAGIVVSGAPADEPVFVRVDDAAKKPVSWFRTVAGARVVVPLRRGRYSARVVGPARSSAPTPFTVEDAGETVDVAAQGAAEIHCEVRDESGSGLPARIEIRGDGVPDPELGPWTHADGQGNVVHAPTGDATIRVPPGRYRVRASHGPEWEIAAADVDARAGRPARVTLPLRRVVDTTGYLAADMHQHVMVSVDSGTVIRDRVIGSVCEGVELVVATDHNWLTDYSPTIASLGLTNRLRALVGEEVTPDVSASPGGHFNVFPMTIDASAPRAGAFDARDLPPVELFARAQAGDRPRVIQVNHPRAPKNGFFERAQLDPATGQGNGLWDPGFDAVEVWNGKRFDQIPAVLADVRSFWTRGIPYTATGNSDTHDLCGQEPGYPRTYLRVPTEDAVALREEDVVRTLRATHDAIVTNGPFIRLEVAGASIGGFVAVPEGHATAHVDVQAPSWIEIGTIEVVLSGATIETEPIPRTPGQPVHYTRDFDIPLAHDAWVEVVVRGETPHPLLDGDTPAFAFTNPIWLDADGNGRYDPPP